MFKKQPWKQDEQVEGADGGSVEQPQVEASEPVAAEPEPMDARSVIEREMNKLEAAEQKPEDPAAPKAERKRDEHGKFAPKESESEAETKKPQQTQEQVKERNPWNSWKPEYVEQIKKLPQEAQDYILKRQEQFHRGLDQYREEAAYAKNIKSAIAQYEPYMAQLGVTPEVAFSNLLKTEHTLRTGDQNAKMQMMRKLAHDYGIDLGQAVQQPFDPNMHRMEQQLSQLQYQLQASQNSRQSAEEGQLNQTIEQFAQSHEYFDDVRETMADLLDRGIAKDLDDAYAKAVRLDDGVFQKMQAKQLAEMERQKLAQSNQAAQAAKASAVSVRGAPTGVSYNKTPTSTEEAVRMAMAQHGL